MKFTALALLSAAAAAIADKVSVTLYYEALCPGCHEFITTDLKSAIASVGDFMDVELLPYGNARTNADGSVTCQHGDDECKANIWSDCAIAHYPAVEDHFPFIECMEENFSSQLTSAKTCATKANMDYDALSTCATGAEGQKLLVEVGEKTGDHQYVPWVIVDGELADSYTDFVDYICDHITGDKPAACSEERVVPASKKPFDHFCYHEEHLVNLGIDDTVVAHFNEFKVAHSKVYATIDEEFHALTKFYESMVRLAKKSNPAHGITKFSDMTPEEFKATYLNRGFRSTEEIEATPKYDGSCAACKRFPEHANYNADSGLDWTTKGAVTGVKDQGQCGSCWAFGTIGDIEGTHFLAGNDLTSLSEQQIVSCDTTYGDMGCNGGLPEQAFKYVMDIGGVVKENDYSYTSGTGNTGTCNKKKEGLAKVADIDSFVQVSNAASGESDIVDAVTKSGPVVIGIDAEPMQDYWGGIDNPSCGSSAYDLDHAVVIVGYGTENGQDYWKIKNSWATSWGEDGYYRIVRGVNKCGLAMDVCHSVVNSKTEETGTLSWYKKYLKNEH